MSNSNPFNWTLNNKSYIASSPANSVVTTSGGTGDCKYWYVTEPKKNDLGNVPDVEKIIYNDRTTIVYWTDGSKSRSTCVVGEIFDEEIGLAVCTMKKLFGKKIHGTKLYKRIIANAERQT